MAAMNRTTVVVFGSTGLALALMTAIVPSTGDARSAPAARRVRVAAGTLSGDIRWRSNVIHELAGELRLASSATLTIEPGTRIEAAAGSRIVVPRTSRIVAIGTPLEPIVFTCEGTARYSGCWGGIVIQGFAPINTGQATSPAARDNAQAGCREVVDAEVGGFYGGCDQADSSGALRYVRIEYAEFDGLRLEGVGSRTVLEAVQLNRGLSTGLSVVGGMVNLKRIVFTANGGTGLAWTGGWRGKAQFLLMQLDLARGITAVGGMSGDNGTGSAMDNLPRSAPEIYNVSLLGILPPRPGTMPPMLILQQGTAGTFGNLLMYKPPIGVSVKGASTCAQIASATLKLSNSVVIGATSLGDPDADPSPCAGFASPNVESEWVQSAAYFNEIVTDPTATNAAVKGPAELITLDGRPTLAFGGALNPPTDGFFDAAANYVGALPPVTAGLGAIPWHSGWTAPAPVPPPTPLGALAGVVASLQTGPLAGVTITAIGTGVQSSSSAAGRFDLLALPAGPLDVSATGVASPCVVPSTVQTRVPANGSGQVAVLAICGVSGGAVDVSAGGSHTCAIASTGAASCWGNNAMGEVGDGTTGNQRANPTPLVGDVLLAGVRAGEVSMSCGLTSSGGAECWGATTRASATRVATTASFRALAVGANHVCAVTVLGDSLCWGQNTSGQLGDGGSVTASAVPVLTTGGHAFTQVVAGLVHTCGLTTSGAAWCWGSNTLGQVGDGTLGNVRPLPEAVAGAHVFTSISAGAEHTCGLKANGEAWCWGSGTWGKLGTGAAVGPTPAPVQVVGGLTFARIEAGGDHTCGLTTSGAAWCWGANFSGQLGDNTTTDATSPRAVQGGFVYTALSAGGQHTCGVTTIGTLLCWGRNASGQLGVGAGVAQALTPMPVPFN